MDIYVDHSNQIKSKKEPLRYTHTSMKIKYCSVKEKMAEIDKKDMPKVYIMQEKLNKQS